MIKCEAQKSKEGANILGQREYLINKKLVLPTQSYAEVQDLLLLPCL
jgi:hypothetical protein